MKQISIFEYLSKDAISLDVRSPIEFNHGSIPNALNLPLFSDEERKTIGTIYKKQGKRLAIEKGLELVNFPRIVQQIRSLDLPSSVVVYCARGGMRSSSMGWLLNLIGYEVFTIEGGYKSFRRWAQNQFSLPHSLIVLGGETGSKKTKILKELSTYGESVIDLEGLAHHRGSVFGWIDKQPTQEQFENQLAISLYQKKDRAAWLEDESERIGSLSIPPAFFRQIKAASMIVLQVPIESRIEECMNEYLSLGQKELSIAIHRLQKRLGGLATKTAIEALEQKQYRECCRILLCYYDKKYRYGMSLKNPEKMIFLPTGGISMNQIIENLKAIRNRL
jgi:tRNA 2-selenouridine synthase